MKVYIVFQGIYSDRGTSGVYSSEQDARNHIENHRDRKADGSPDDYDDWDIEEWEVGGECILKNRSMWCVDIAKNGTTLYVGREPNDTEKSYEFSKQWNMETMRFDVIEKMICYVEAEDEKHAVKIANEKRVQLIAEDKWNVNDNS